MVEKKNCCFWPLSHWKSIFRRNDLAQNPFQKIKFGEWHLLQFQTCSIHFSYLFDLNRVNWMYFFEKGKNCTVFFFAAVAIAAAFSVYSFIINTFLKSKTRLCWIYSFRFCFFDFCDSPFFHTFYISRIENGSAHMNWLHMKM